MRSRLLAELWLKKRTSGPFLGMPAAVFDGRKVLAEVNERLNQRYSAGREVKYVLGGEMPYVELDSRAFAAVKVGEAEAEGVVAEMLPEALEATLPKEPEGVSQVRLAGRPSIRHVYTRMQMAAGQVAGPDDEPLTDGRRELPVHPALKTA